MCGVILRWNLGKVTLPMRVALIHRYVSQKAVNAMKATKTTKTMKATSLAVIVCMCSPFVSDWIHYFGFVRGIILRRNKQGGHGQRAFGMLLCHGAFREERGQRAFGVLLCYGPPSYE